MNLRRGLLRRVAWTARVVPHEGSQGGRELGSWHDHVDHAVREQELGGLKSLGQLLRVICSMTLGPANPMRAPGSASTTSATVAYEAVTPP